MDQIIVTVLAIGALCLGLRDRPWSKVAAHARVTQGVLLRRLRTRL